MKRRVNYEDITIESRRDERERFCQNEGLYLSREGDLTWNMRNIIKIFSKNKMSKAKDVFVSVDGFFQKFFVFYKFSTKIE